MCGRLCTQMSQECRKPFRFAGNCSALPGFRIMFCGCKKKKNYSYCFAGPDFTLTDDRNGSFYFSNSISNAWKDSDLTVVPVVKKLVEAGLRIWIFR
jgi:hypothetical protein